MSAEFDYEIAQNGQKIAPERDEIESLTDIRTVRSILMDASDTCITIETQLEFLDDGDERLKHSRVNALICWRKVMRQAKDRIAQIDRDRQQAARTARSGASA